MRIHATISLLSWTYGHCTGSDSVGTYISRAASWGEQLRNTTTTSTHWPSAMGLEEVTVRGGPEHCDARTWTNLLRIISPRPGCRYWQLQLWEEISNLLPDSHICAETALARPSTLTHFCTAKYSGWGVGTATSSLSPRARVATYRPGSVWAATQSSNAGAVRGKDSRPGRWPFTHTTPPS